MTTRKERQVQKQILHFVQDDKAWVLCLDMLIAAHAIANHSILVTRDQALSQVEVLHPVVNWATDV